MEEAVVKLLKKYNLTVTTAESCTGGMVAARLINVPGVSDCLNTGYITYADKTKRKLLGVRKRSLKKKGAVSAEVAAEMAEGAALFSKADVAIATTGIAGPDGGSEQKPVGLVYIACNVKGNMTVKECHFSGNRMKIRETTVANALILMRECILEYGKKKEYENGDKH